MTVARATAIRGGQLLTRRGTEWHLERRDVEVDGGVVAALGPDRPPSGAVGPGDVDASGLLALPGLINAHYHSHDNLVRGLAPEQPLELWSLAYSGMRNDYTAEEAYYSTLLGCAELLASGCTAVIDHLKFSPHLDPELLDAACRAYLDAGMRACIVPVVADRPYPETLPLSASEREACGTGVPTTTLSAAEQLERVDRLHARWHGADGRLQIGIGPSGPQRCSDELLTAAAAWADEHRVPVHMHVLETRLQQAVARRLYGRTMLEHLADLGLLSPRTHLVHTVWATAADLDLIADRGAVVVHNPTSNVRLGSGTAPVPQMLARGIEVALGVDSACCNDSNDLFAAMKWATLIHNLSDPDPATWLHPGQALTFATHGGGVALGGVPAAGAVAVGNAADLVFIDLAAPGLVPLNAPIRQLVLAAGAGAVARVMVAGSIVYERGRPTRFDLAEVHDRVRALAARRIDRNRGVRTDAGLEGAVMGAYRRIVLGAGDGDDER